VRALISVGAYEIRSSRSHSFRTGDRPDAAAWRDDETLVIYYISSFFSSRSRDGVGGIVAVDGC
jgi:hypothetical protein